MADKRFTDTIEEKLAVIAPTVKTIEFGCSGRFRSDVPRACRRPQLMRILQRPSRTLQ
jgi:hypothetical protein